MRDYGESPSAIALQLGIDPALFLGLIKQESGGNQYMAGARGPATEINTSSAGALGLTQLLPGTAKELGVDPTDPFENLYGGAKYLKQQLDRFGSPYDALRAYNAGPTGASRDPTAGQEYANSILGYAGMESPHPTPESSLGGDLIGGAIDKLTSYGAQGLVWLAVGLLVVFGVYALITSPAVVPA